MEESSQKYVPSALTSRKEALSLAHWMEAECQSGCNSEEK
jgi:hypothetical protein